MLFIPRYLKKYGTMCCIVPYFTLSLFQQTKKVKKILIISFIIVATIKGNSQENKQDLYKEIAHMDSVLFNAFNNHDIATIKKLFSTDLEFYHDKGGLTNYDQNIKASEEIFSRNNGLRRTLVAGSMKVYPLPGYGALQTGEHMFCHEENGKTDCGTFKFDHIWKKTNGEWKLTRVISYDHN